MNQTTLFSKVDNFPFTQTNKGENHGSLTSIDMNAINVRYCLYSVSKIIPERITLSSNHTFLISN